MIILKLRTLSVFFFSTLILGETSPRLVLAKPARKDPLPVWIPGFFSFSNNWLANPLLSPIYDNNQICCFRLISLCYCIILTKYPINSISIFSEVLLVNFLLYFFLILRTYILMIQSSQVKFDGSQSMPFKKIKLVVITSTA